VKTTLLAALLLAALPSAAMSAVLYKSIGPNGVVEFSDVPPTDRSQVVESRLMGSRSQGALQLASADAGGLPIYDNSGALARANAELDLAEHALAGALRSIGSPLAGLHLSAGRATSSDLQRIDFFRRNVQLARANLLELTRGRSTP
jgi:hypothetical protein